MPLYEYACTSCSRRYEAYVKAWSDTAACPGCESEAVERQLSTFAMAVAGGSSSGDFCAREAAPRMSGGGGCCGGGCGCGH